MNSQAPSLKPDRQYVGREIQEICYRVEDLFHDIYNNNVDYYFSRYCGSCYVLNEAEQASLHMNGEQVRALRAVISQLRAIAAISGFELEVESEALDE